jgi:MarR family transcriptional regulator, 2-MHQ and catechol-resistance regulon repressor
VVITDKGQKLLNKVDSETDNVSKIMGNLSEKDAGMLTSLLDKLRGTEDI